MWSCDDERVVIGWSLMVEWSKGCGHVMVEWLKECGHVMVKGAWSCNGQRVVVM